MGLSLQPTRRTSGKIATLIAVFALIAQPMYGLVANRVANAVTPSTTVNQPNLVSTGWHVAKVGASLDFVAAADAPIGNGALKMSKGNVTGDYAQFYRESMSPMDLSDISFKYSSKRLGGSNVAAPGFGITIDMDGDFTTEGDLRWYMYEPTYNSSVTDYNVWNEWSIDSSSKVWQLSRPSGSPWVLHTIGDLSVANAKVKDYWLNIGTGGNGTSVLVDKVVEGNSVTYNFEPLVIEPCLTPTSKHFTSLGGWDVSQTSTDGSASNQVTAAGLRVKTQASGHRKAAAYYPVDFALRNLGANTNDILDITVNSGSIQPGGQLVVDFNGDGTSDGILVGEPTASGYGNNWWLNNAAKQEVKDNAPHTGGGYGSPWYGEANEWLNAFPAAQVKAVGYSMGSGVTGDYTITRISAGCVNYTFGPDVTKPEAPTAKFYDSNNAQRPHTSWSTTENFKFELASQDDGNIEGYELRYWNSIEGSRYSGETNAWTRLVGSDGIYSDRFSQGEGIHYFSFKAIDEAGNKSDWSSPFMIGYDKTMPEITVTNLTDGQVITPSTDGKIIIKGNFADPLSGANYAQIQLVHNGNSAGFVTKHGPVTDGTLAEFDVASLPEGGNYYIQVNAVDAAGNVTSWQRFNFTLDKTAPTISIKTGAGANDGSRGNSPYYRQVSFKLYDKNGNLKEVLLNGHAYARGGTWNDLNWVNINKSHLIEGAENTVIVKDKAGNQSTLNFFFDSIAPASSMQISSSAQNGNYHRGIVTVKGMVENDEKNIKSHWFEITNPDGDMTYVYDMNSSSLEHEFNLDTSKGDGVYKIRYVATDKAGNRSDINASTIRTIRVDNTAPEAPVITALSSRGVSGTAEPGSAVTVYVDDARVGETIAATDGTWGLAFIPAYSAFRTYTVTATSTDTANNTSDASTPRQFILAQARPAVTITNQTVTDTSSLNNLPTTTTPTASVLPAGDTVIDDTTDEDATTDGVGEVAALTTDGDEDGEVKAAEDVKDSWSLINLLLTIAVAAASIFALIGLAGKREDRNIGARLLTVVPALGAGAVLLFAEDFSGQMSWVNIWTLLVGALLVVQMILLANTKTETE